MSENNEPQLAPTGSVCRAFFLSGFIIPLALVLGSQLVFHLIADVTKMDVSLKITLTFLGLVIGSFLIVSIGIAYALYDAYTKKVSHFQMKVLTVITVVLFAGSLGFVATKTSYFMDNTEKAIFSYTGPSKTEMSTAIQKEYGFVKVDDSSSSDMSIIGTTTNGKTEKLSLMQYKGVWVMYRDKADLNNRLAKIDQGSYPESLLNWSPNFGKYR